MQARDLEPYMQCTQFSSSYHNKVQEPKKAMTDSIDGTAIARVMAQIFALA